MNIIQTPSANFNARPDGAAIDTVIIHYTGMPTGRDALARLCDPAAEVSAHYVIDEDGTIYALVEEGCRAWHAGKSTWAGRGNLNDVSLGIELVNPGHEFGYRPFSLIQMQALVHLCHQISERHPIAYYLGHSDVAINRKVDPGEKFNWGWLAGHGFGVWPQPHAQDFEQGAALLADPAAMQAALVAIGYDENQDLPSLAAAFNRHFSANADPLLDEMGAARLAWLARHTGLRVI